MKSKPFLHRRILVAIKSCLAAFSFSADAAEPQKAAQIHYPLDSQETFTGPEALFSGEVQVKMLFPENDTAHYSGAYVTFQPGARTAWHQHPAGQHMVVTDGTALTGTRDGKVIEFHQGETVWCPKEIDHWHGATPHSAMTHLVVTGSKDGANVIWKEKVTDQQYLAAQKQQTVDIKILNKPQQAMVAIAAFTASGELQKLQKAVADGLDSGLTINEIKEIQMHLYAYAGFPRSLNALATTMQVIATRKSNGIADAVGVELDPLAGPQDSLAMGIKVQTQLAGQPVTGPLFDFAPYSNVLLQKHLFGDLFARDILDFKSREIATVAALANMPAVTPQLTAHIGIAVNAGLTHKQLQAIAQVLANKVNQASADAVTQALNNSNQ
ncbi:carboxymuconolactone decarboxylase family protein [Thiomicrorhabdus sp. 6S2-11]|uniref:Carboxymuconolactone decarboxylase family protein n=1 Tax=Thiomicrorhabdus marina TaxID=2818442 RepID=A0ABS3Q391_9GAMM|nr:carboxymuconolactone decarboxylase family protein [Thiomicrorhabdus marina]MBO1926767.1 carboxymuconolactone decarboxylase family protein [Thiomicrorhabdus marina]